MPSSPYIQAWEATTLQQRGISVWCVGWPMQSFFCGGCGRSPSRCTYCKPCVTAQAQHYVPVHRLSLSSMSAGSLAPLECGHCLGCRGPAIWVHFSPAALAEGLMATRAEGIAAPTPARLWSWWLQAGQACPAAALAGGCGGVRHQSLPLLASSPCMGRRPLRGQELVDLW